MTIRKIQKIFAGVLTVSVLTASLFGGSALASETETVSETTTEAASEAGSEESTGTRTIVDHTGAEVVLPEKIERVVISSILPLPSVYCLFRGSADDIVGIHPSSMAAAENSYLINVFPETRQCGHQLRGKRRSKHRAVCLSTETGCCILQRQQIPKNVKCMTTQESRLSASPPAMSGL